MELFRTDFNEFVKYLDRLLLKINLNRFYKKCILNLLTFINDIIQGLYNLKQTYADTKKMVSKVDSIILILLDFKEKVNKAKNNKMFIFLLS